MPRIVVNGEDYAAGTPAGTWSELLASLDRDLEPRGFVVTAVRVDGIDRPGFREDARRTEPLTHGAIIEVEAATPAALLEDGLHEAARAVGALQHAAIDLAGGYRLADVSAANAHLAAFAETLANLMALVAAAGQALRVELDTLRVADRHASVILRQLNAAIQALLDAHQARDWVTLADVLEHDLAPLMPGLGQVIDALVAPAR